MSMEPDSKSTRLISSFPITAENYPKALEQLKLRFGREDLLVQIYVRNFLSLVLKNATTAKNAPDLATLYDMLETKLRALESLGHTKEKFADFLKTLMESCLPENVLRVWERRRISESTDDATSQRSLEKLMCFLCHEVKSEEMICLAPDGFDKDRGSGAIQKDCQRSVHKDEPTAAMLISSTTGAKLNCIFCDRPHLSQDYQKLSEMSYEDRKSQVIRKRCCLICLKVGHLAKRYHSRVRCLICKRRHYPLLCPDLRKEKETTFSLRNRDKEVCVRALLDDGSQRSYIEKNLAAELFLSPSGREIFSQGLFGGGISPASEHKRYMVNVESLNHKYTPLSLLEQQNICSTLPRIHDRKLLSEPASRGIKLRDVGRDSPPIRVLLGADILGNILTGRIEVLSSGVSAVDTLLGWTILGLGKKREVVNLVTLSLQNMDETIRICDQRYEVVLPWLAGHPALYDKYDAAESRLCTATKHLINENYFEAYDNGFKEWESEGIIEAVPIDQLAKEVHYLPHRPVTKPSSNTTKVRPVFDASFKKPGFAFLNECLSAQDVVSDELSCKLPSNLDCTQERPVTKRVLLSVINSVYDPIGFKAPALLLPKLLMQGGKIGWDEVLLVELEHKYRLWEKTMHLVSKCTIPRRFFAKNCDDSTLHVFTDASAYAYITCAFLRCEFKGQVTVKLIAAKARLAPMKKSTIPRLELMGAALGARLAETTFYPTNCF
ncbi:DUF1758 domain-containing protein [Trichonephila inaurata madagascariensis]|uniref:DUF1758 domain-containing protein n=1 Tax=Trichonephila inaurata madagascariensis TaxID=2747483 RepID=A0A8X6XTE7_9ARAC|nr:DUF1758 domain-containing protein [Trichonephila inaurata madagascariensis]